MAWLQGMYVYHAFDVVVSNAFSKKGAKRVDYMDKPISEQKPEQVVVTEEMSEEEKAEKRKMLMDQLHIMMANFELSQKEKNAKGN